jgi:hypothetical protein
MTINWTRRPSIPDTTRNVALLLPTLGDASACKQGNQRTHIIIRCQPLHLQPRRSIGKGVQAEKRREKMSKGGSGSRGFYGGSLLKVRSRRSLSGDFLPKREEETPRKALCACASLRFFERGTLEEEGKLVQETFLHWGGGRENVRPAGRARRKETGACKGAWEALAACAGDFLC